MPELMIVWASCCTVLDLNNGLQESSPMPIKYPRIQKNSRHERSNIKVYNKRRTNRAMRRMARQDPGNAPRKPRHYDYSE